MAYDPYGQFVQDERFLNIPQDFPLPGGETPRDWFAENVPPAASSYTGPVPPGFSQADVEDFLRRNPGDEHRVGEALVRSPQPTAPSGGGFSFGGAGAPQSIQPYSTPFSFDQSKVGDSQAFKFRFDKAMEAIQRSGAARGTLLNPQTWKAMQDEASGLASQETQAEYGRQLGTYGQNFDVHAWNEGNRFNSQRANRGDDFSFMDTNRRFDRGIYEGDRAFSYGQNRDDMADYWRGEELKYGAARR